MSYDSISAKPQEEDPKFLSGPVFGEQLGPDSSIDGEDGAIPEPINVMGDKGAMCLTPSSTPGPTNRYYKDKLVWAAKYKDGTTIPQYKEDHTPVSTDHLPRENLRVFMLIDNYDRVAFVQEFFPGDRFIYRRRTALRTGKDVIEIIHIIGRIRKIGDQEFRHVSFIYESDLHIEMGDFRKDMRDGYGRIEQWRYPVKEMEPDLIVIT